MTVTIDGSAGITTPGETITGTGSKITGDFTNATVASRNSFQTSTTNGSTGIYALPNGSSTAASWQATNAADPTNASKILIATNGSTDVQLVSGINGTGTYLPLSFYTNGTQQMQLSTAGILTGTAGNLMLVQGTSQASTSGTSITFSSIPSWVKRITVSLQGVSTNGSSQVGLQVGSGSVQTSGYNGTGWGGASSVFATTANWSNIAFTNDAGTAAATRSGTFVLTLVSGNTWVISAVMAQSDAARTMGGAGYVTLSGALDRVVITTVNGTDTFDAGSINIQYE